MSITITNESKNTAITITNEDKGQSKTWATAGGTWADHPKSTWAKQREYLTNESKNNLTITNENKT